MIKHIVVFRFRPDVPDTEVEELLAELETFPTHFPAMRRWSSGTNRSRRDTTFTHAFTVEFDDEAQLNAYLDSERHERFVRERWRPRVEERAIVSYHVPQPAHRTDEGHTP